MRGKAVDDSVKPFLIAGGRNTPLKISHFEDSMFQKKKIITNEIRSPSQRQLQFFARHWSSKRET